MFGPLGKDGYFQPLIDQRTGVIDKTVARYWDEHYDLLHFLQRNWTTLGPKVVNKLHVYVGDMDTYQLDKGVVLIDTTLPAYRTRREMENLFSPRKLAAE